MREAWKIHNVFVCLLTFFLVGGQKKREMVARVIIVLGFQHKRLGNVLKYQLLSHFFYYDKTWNGKICISIWDVKTFCHLQIWKKWHLMGKIQLKPTWICRIQMAKFSHLQINIFCYFNFSHNRRNGFYLLRFF